MKIAVLISGGVDSAVVVHKLYNEGHDLHLFYIRIGMDNDEGDCSAEEDIEMCSLIAHKYNLPFKVVSLHKEYWDHVMAYTLETVKNGLTPHPDIMCNKMIKFGFFEQRWGKDFDKTATGHYASIHEHDGKLFLATAVDPVKDQTDFLAQISYDQLSHIMFPLGNLSKAEVRKIAKEANLPNASRKDSQGICFLGKINYNDFIARHLGEKTGPIIDIDTGQKIGVHKGYWFHTIGQRKGLGLSGGPWYVVKKNIKDNVVYVSKGYDTRRQYGRLLPLVEPNWISGDPFTILPEDNSGNAIESNDIESNAIDLVSSDSHPTDSPATEPSFIERRIMFKNRHSPDFLPGKLIKDNDELFILADVDVQGIAPGQFAIIYSTDRRLCLGSAMITTISPKLEKQIVRKFSSLN